MRARISLVLATALGVCTSTAAAQQSPIEPDSARAQIQTALRAFYFNLDHQDWEALTADILAAKVIASRAVPKSMVAPAPASDRLPCSSDIPTRVSRAAIAFDGDWAEVSVPRCTVASAGSDEFRLIHFEERWRFVYIDLYDGDLNLSIDR
jgi:hypothetical protein